MPTAAPLNHNQIEEQGQTAKPVAHMSRTMVGCQIHAPQIGRRLEHEVAQQVGADVELAVELAEARGVAAAEPRNMALGLPFGGQQVVAVCRSASPS